MKDDPIRKDTLKKQAASEQAIKEGGRLADQPLHRSMLYKLAADRKRLTSIQSMQARDVIKRDEVLPEYASYVEGVLEADEGQPDEVLMQVMVWAFDARNIEQFDLIARYAVANQLPMPKDFSRGTGAWLAESCAKLVMSMTASREQLNVTDEEVLEDLTLWLSEETVEVDMHDEVRAKLYHAVGDIQSPGDPAAAIECYQKALRYRDKEPVKKKMAALEKRIAAETESPSPQGQATDGSATGGSAKTKASPVDTADPDASAGK